MCVQNNITNVISVLLIICTSELGVVVSTLDEAKSASLVTFNTFTTMFMQCTFISMPNQQFKIDNLKGFIYPGKTTVGVFRKMTSNRKFFANVLSTNAFKDMLKRDTTTIWKNIIKKMKYCDNVIMNQDAVKDFYDREVDQSKL